MQTIDIITDGPVSGFTKGIINAQIPPECINLMDTTPVEVEITPWQSNAHHRHMVGGSENSYLIITHPPSLGGLNMDTVFRYAYKRFITGAKVASSTADCIGVLLLAQQELSINPDTVKLVEGLVEYYLTGLAIIKQGGGYDGFVSLKQGPRTVVIQYKRSN